VLGDGLSLLEGLAARSHGYLYVGMLPSGRVSVSANYTWQHGDRVGACRCWCRLRPIASRESIVMALPDWPG
jgi:hypothetical protein